MHIVCTSKDYRLSLADDYRFSKACESNIAGPELPAAGLEIEGPPAGAAAEQAVASREWTSLRIGQAVCLYILAAAFEVGGGWLIWQTVREHRPW